MQFDSSRWVLDSGVSDVVSMMTASEISPIMWPNPALYTSQVGKEERASLVLPLSLLVPANFKHASSLDYLAMICCNQAFRVALTLWVKLR